MDKLTVDLRLGDCLEEMKSIPTGSVDMVLTDMPYGTTRNRWDSILDLDALWKEYHRVGKVNCAYVLFAQIPFVVTLGASNLKNLRYEWVWQKTNPTGHLNANKMPMKAHENILVFYRKLPTYNRQMREGFTPYTTTRGHDSTNYGAQQKTTTVNTDGSRYPIDVIEFSKKGGKSFHPTEKPTNLLEYLILTYTNEGETVLDSCMGSGSTGVACQATNRNFIGIELLEEYFAVAKQRMKIEV